MLLNERKNRAFWLALIFKLNTIDGGVVLGAVRLEVVVVDVGRGLLAV